LRFSKATGNLIVATGNVIVFGSKYFAKAGIRKSYELCQTGKDQLYRYLPSSKTALIASSIGIPNGVFTFMSVKVLKEIANLQVVYP
jgi:hypothetical protein